MIWTRVFWVFFILFSTIANSSEIEHVVLIGIDGLGSHNAWRKFKPRTPKIPHLESLIKEGAWTKKAKIDPIHYSGPNWMGILTGSRSYRHGVRNNFCRRGRGLETIFKVIRDQRPNSEIGVIYDWKSIGCYVEKGTTNYKKWTQNESHTMKLAIDYLNRKRPTFLFIYLGGVDKVGHRRGGMSWAYKRQVERTDRHIGEVLTALEKNGMKEKTLVIVTSDHGHKRFGHSNSRYPVPLILSGPRVIKGKMSSADPIRNNQVAPLIAYALDLVPSSDWGSNVAPLDEYFER